MPRPASASRSRRLFEVRVGFTLACAALAAVWLLPSGLLLSARDTDVVGQFVAWRSFAAERILAGDLPLWNPHTYSGQPFVGGFQSALFYPPNVMFLFLPIERAINLCFLWHLLWLAWGMGRWARERGLHPWAAALAGVVLPLSGPVFPHLYAGHLSNICTMAWAPWVFVGLDRWSRDARRGGLLLAAAAVGMQILAGHVQYAFYTAIAAGLYAVVMSMITSSGRRSIPALLLVYLGGAGLAAVQLLPGLTAAAEGLRGGRADFSYVRGFSFPPENLVTLVAPGFFGGVSMEAGAPLYWGRGYLWEMTIFAGVSGVMLALVALHERVRAKPRSLGYLVIPVLLAVGALGANTPLLRVLYDWVPGFDSLRGLSKFMFPLMLFAGLAIAAGADALIRGRAPSRALAMVAGIIGAGLFTGGVWLLGEPDRARGWLAAIRDSEESGLAPDLLGNAAFVRGAGMQAGSALLTAGLLFVVVAGSMLLARRSPLLRLAPLVLLPIEMVAFAAGHLVTSSVDDAVPDAIQAFVASRPGDYRVVNVPLPNNGFLLGVPDAGGNDPAVLRRYAEFVTASEGGDPGQATQHLPFSKLGPALAMLRVRFAFVAQKDGIHTFENRTPPLPPALLVSTYRVAPTRADVLAEVLRDGFDPRHTVWLEQTPSPEPVSAGPPGTVRVLSQTADTLEIEALTPAPTILVVTDPYSRDWRARPLTPGPQAGYEVLVANYVLRAVPLAAGHHRLLLEYRPALLATGALVSLLAVAALLALWLVGRPRSVSAPVGDRPRAPTPR